MNANKRVSQRSDGDADQRDQLQDGAQDTILNQPAPAPGPVEEIEDDPADAEEIVEEPDNEYKPNN